MTQQVRKVAIIGGSRIPFARSNTAYSHASNQDMLTAALNGLVNKFDLQGKRMGEVVAGSVIKHSRDFNLTRESVLSTALDADTPCIDIQQACGTGLQATMLVANKIALGQIECGIAGGSDTTSDAPIGVSEGLRKILLDLNRAKSNVDKLKVASRIRPKHLIPLVPANGEPRTNMSMGQHCEVTVKEWGTQREAQDEIAFNSHRNLAAAYKDGFFDDLVVPFNGLEKDNLVRADVSMDKLASLKPAFDKKSGKGTLTAGNSSALTDGASAVLLASEEWAKENNLPVQAYLTVYETASVDFIGKDRDYKEGLLMAPTYGISKMLDRAGLSLQDFDFYEIHEAFAGVVLTTLAALDDETFCKERLGRESKHGAIDRSKLNVKGSSIAVGHPFAATGGRIVATLAKMLEEKGSGRGLISICAAGGQGVTAILERP
ncbi:acetyl-CoA C-acetyltransferase [Litoribacillus peritrichatus]|uniref:Acetyl-CoA C-acetyltransferase n=1 Tax=Litoribacillus peritrichatus TaxID=718191 RepID=A0ABP7MFX7_9GAMM